MLPRRKIRRRKIRIPLHNQRLRLRKAINQIIIQIQMIFNNLLRREAQPLVDANVAVLARLQDLIITVSINRICFIVIFLPPRTAASYSPYSPNNAHSK